MDNDDKYHETQLDDRNEQDDRATDYWENTYYHEW